MRAKRANGTTERGFTLVELLVVVVIIAILASIAIPIFFQQREKGFRAQVVSDLREGATTMQAWATDNDGDYEPPHGDGSATVDMAWLESQGWRRTEDVTVDIVGPGITGFCLQGTHAQVGTLNLQYRSGTGTVRDGSCL